MAIEEGFVANTSDDGWAQVITKKGGACGDCRASHCCSSLGSSSKMVVKALNNAGAKAGDLVTLGRDRHTATKSAAIAYMIPVAGLISGAIVGNALSQKLGTNESTASVLLALVGLAVGFSITLLLSKWMSAHGRLTPVITNIMRTGGAAPESFTAIDPVCNMVVNPATAAASSIYKDRIYYFCDSGCKDSFLKDPERYL